MVALLATGCTLGCDATAERNEVLRLVLQTEYQDGGFTVVDPMTSLGLGSEDAESWASNLARNQSDPELDKAVIESLLNKLIELNKKPQRLTIDSSPSDGYLIDYDGKFDKYFEDGGGGWDQWYKENPKAHGSTQVSLPACDQDSGLAVVYKGTQSHWLAGAGYLILYRYESGKLNELNRLMLWIS